jgi:hypothetical protein
MDIVAWWATWPAETIAGTLVSDRVSYSMFAGVAAGLDEGAAGLTFPPGYLEEVRGKLDSPEQISFAEVRRFFDIGEEEFERGRELLGKPPATPPEDPVVALCRTLAAARSYHAIALDLLDRGQPDLLAIYYEGIDQIGHRFMHYAPPQTELATPAETLARRRDQAITAIRMACSGGAAPTGDRLPGPVRPQVPQRPTARGSSGK